MGGQLLQKLNEQLPWARCQPLTSLVLPVYLLAESQREYQQFATGSRLCEPILLKFEGWVQKRACRLPEFIFLSLGQLASGLLIDLFLEHEHGLARFMRDSGAAVSALLGPWPLRLLALLPAFGLCLLPVVAQSLSVFKRCTACARMWRNSTLFWQITHLSASDFINYKLRRKWWKTLANRKKKNWDKTSPCAWPFIRQQLQLRSRPARTGRWVCRTKN